MTPLEPAAPAELRTAIIASAERFREATSRLRGILDLADHNIDLLLDHVATDVPVATVLEELDIARVREAITDAVSEFSMSRHRLRLSIFSLLVAEGMTSSEIAVLWGFSRQMAMKQIRKLDNLPLGFE